MSPLPTPLTDLLPELVPELAATARAAGAATLRFYGDDTDAATKADGSPVTAADTAAEAVILPVLRRLTPDVPIVSEEEFAAGLSPETVGRRFWLVDPLDGTKEFIRRNGEFTVNIALVEDGVPVLGLVHVPVGDTLYVGSLTGGAWRGTGDGPQVPIRVRPVPADGLTVLSSRSHADDAALEAWLAGMPVKDRLAAGSSVKFCRIAEGLGDLYPRLGPTMEWDTAAGQAVLLAAGGRVETLDGRPFTYGKPGFRNPHFVARGGPGA